MKPVTIYTTPTCPYCRAAKALLDEKGVDYNEINVESNMERRAEMMSRSGRRSVPQIFVGETHVGGCDDLYELERQGGFESLLVS
ncbi:glutaredoxin 3 [Pararobbsia alpina]|jgi:glutaredoxin 3|uniref:glutaredoxin 3 n=1 Tax=Pararobbsia alpina TaxID=621374 RepID=UPI0039A6B11F